LAAAGHGLLVSFSGADRTSGAAAIEAVNPRAIIDLPGQYARPDGADDGGWVDGMASHLHAQVVYLSEAGHRGIAIATSENPTPFEMMLTDYSRAAMRGLGLPDPIVVTTGDEESLSGAIRGLPESVTAIAAQTDTIAFAVLAALLNTGIRVPDRMAVIGLGDVPEAALWRPPLTTVRVDTRSYGRRLARQ
ncbi:substrate-binding domain-containing protein, partial [Rhizobium johnstonii]|uniref:substrate-binding domain-containing protein n=1 Tax=Rhizobium johnstonii TaxID=3019933 RepID=UPI003F9E7FD5